MMHCRCFSMKSQLKKAFANHGIYYKPRLEASNWGTVVDKDIFNEFDILIVSPGGSGCSLVHGLLDKHGGAVRKNLNSDKDGLKHLSSPRQNIFQANSFRSILYVYNDPLLGILSHYRREWHVMQHKKICDFNDIDVEKIYTFEAFCSSVIKEARDVFGVEKHFMNWFSYRNELNIFFVDFRNPAKVSSKIASMINIEISYKLKKRSASSIAMMHSLDYRIKDIYKAIDNRICSLIQDS